MTGQKLVKNWSNARRYAYERVRPIRGLNSIIGIWSMQRFFILNVVLDLRVGGGGY